MITSDKLNIIIPLYNPRAGWEDQFIDSILQIKKELSKTLLTVILVNDGSTIDINIEKIVNRFKYVKYLLCPSNMGKGYAIRSGINFADADFYIYTDIDFPFGCQSIYHTYALLKSSKTNIVIGTRDLSYFKMLPVKRRIYSFLLKKLNYLITGFKIRDTQAGIKGLDNRAKKILANTKTNTFLFELEFLQNSLKEGLGYEFLNVKCRDKIEFTNFKPRILLKESICLLKLLFN